MRGKHVSIPMEELIRQAKSLARNGTKELILIAQDLTYYGLDMYGKRNLSELLKRLADVDGIEWIRLHYAFPTGFPMDILDVMRDIPNICKYLDMPLQHISNRILGSMLRGTTKEKTIDLVNTIRDKIPGIALRTTIMVGYPGETENEFEELKQWVAETKFERLGVFTYSHEENTTAYTLEDNVPKRTKEKRAKEIMEIQREISYNLNMAKIGKTYKVIFDRKEGNYFVGRTEFDSPEVDNEVLVDAASPIPLPNQVRDRPSKGGIYLRIGDFANVKLTGADDYDLYGVVAREHL